MNDIGTLFKLQQFDGYKPERGPENMQRWLTVVLMLVQYLRRWPNINPTQH